MELSLLKAEMKNEFITISIFNEGNNVNENEIKK